ncbi:MAG: RluA family pseudouridine synthase [Hasllibacter sp.]
MSGVRMLTVAAGEGDQRLDRWLRRRVPEITQGRIEKGCRKGEIRVDGARAKASDRVAEGQAVRVPPVAPRADAPHRPAEAAVSGADAAMMRAAVLWRDEHVIALNKPPGLPTQGGTGQGGRHVDALSAALAEGGEKPRLVHRLDKDTSGVLLLARTRAVAKGLTEAFRARTARKIYWAAVAGVPSPRMGTIRYGLVKAGGGGAERMETVHPRDVDATPGAQRATTDYAVIEALAQRAAWCALVPVTGRTHQLRAHMGALGHPVVGDGKYGGRGQENLGDGWGAQMGPEVGRRLHLHARSIAFDHPVTGGRVGITAPLPDHMAATWDLFGWDPAEAPADPFEDAP